MTIPSKKIIVPVAVIAMVIAVFVLFLFNSGKEHPAAGQSDKTSIVNMIHEYTKDKSDEKLTVGLLKGD